MDVARGIAFVAMVAYHFIWDLYFAGLISLDVTVDPLGRLAAKAIAGSFLTIVGMSLVLAAPSALQAGKLWRNRKYWIRIARIVAAALLVSIGSFVLFPDTYIYFGILHAIAVFSVLALPFLVAPAWMAVLGAVVVFSMAYADVEIFDTVWLGWTGLSSSHRPSMDFEPIVPWFGCVLAGIALAKYAFLTLGRERLARWRTRSGSVRILAFMDRNALVLYLVHQPILIAIALTLAYFVDTGPNQAAKVFVESCVGQCTDAGTDPSTCSRRCQCIAEELETSGLSHVMAATRLSALEETRLNAIARSCR